MLNIIEKNNQTKERTAQNAVLTLLSLAILASDWMIGLIAVSEIIIGFLLLLLIATNTDYLKTLNYKFALGVLVFFIIQFSYNLSVEMTFIFNRALYNVVKILFYLFFINIVYNYTRNNNLEKRLLIILNVTAFIAILIGIYITLSILYFDQLPYEFLWRFTRTDLHSYRFRGPGFIVRTRSLFSEPAHLGYYLNMVLGVNLFSRFKNSVPLWVNSFIIMGILITLSYASIAVVGIILLFKIVTLRNKWLLVKQNAFLVILSMIVLGITIFIFRDNLYQTIIVRTSDILSGGDNSAFVRVINSWLYISRETLLLGRGLGHTPPLQNVYAYFLSDMGVFPFILILAFTGYILKANFGLGLTFILLNFQKGGYLSPIFSILVLIILIYALDISEKVSFKNRRRVI